MSGRPVVSVIIATYNRSAVLAYAIRSVLAQSLADLELLVIGDACTDDSAAVVRGFADPRVSWENLAHNCGNQYGPNNRGLERARGRYVAYLGHDDLWHRDHLAGLVPAIEAAQGDLAFAMTAEIAPPPRTDHTLLGLCPGGRYAFALWAPPSSWLHRRDLTERIGPWRDHRTLLMPVDADFLSRADDAGIRIVPVPELTVFKFTSVQRTMAYRDRGAAEQAQWWRRLQADPELRYRTLRDALGALATHHPAIVRRFSLPSGVTPGSLTASFRMRRGLPALPAGPPPAAGSAAGPPLHGDRMVLRHLNAHDDIAPPADRRALHAEATLPADGLFVGTGWHALELDGEGRRWRWIDAGAQIVVTNPSGTRCRLRIELLPGPGQVGVAPVLVVRDAAGAVAAEAAAPGGPLTVTLPITPGPGTIFTLGAAQGGTPTPDDPRILNFRVFAFAWEETPAAAAAPVPLPEDGAALRRLNAADDIGPAAARDALHASGLHASGTLPADGLFVGPGWHPLERDDAGARWRWLDGDAQIVVTRPSGARRRLRIDLVPGPGVAGFAPRLTVRDAAGTVAAVAAAPGGPLTVELPLVPGPGTVFTLGAAEGGRRHPADPRVLNFRVFAVGWADDADAAPADRTVTSDRG